MQSEHSVLVQALQLRGVAIQAPLDRVLTGGAAVGRLLPPPSQGRCRTRDAQCLVLKGRLALRRECWRLCTQHTWRPATSTVLVEEPVEGRAFVNFTLDNRSAES